MSEDTGRTAQRAARSDSLQHLARAGLAAYGLIHLLVAWLVLQLAWTGLGSDGRDDPASDGGQAADQSGALGVLAGGTAGRVLLGAVALGMAGLALWQAVEVLRHRRSLPEPGPDRRRALLQLLRTVATAVVYGYLAVVAARAALGAGQRRGDEQAGVRGVLALPGGVVLVVAVGLVVVAIGVYQVLKGLRSAFLDEIDLDTVPDAARPVVRWVCQLGFVGKGMAFVLVGVVLAWAAVTSRASRATGLDGALRTVADSSVGPAALTAVAVGLVAFAGYCFLRARHPVG